MYVCIYLFTYLIFPFICLFVFACLIATSHKNYFSKILPKKYLWTRRSSSNFGSHPYLDPDLGFFEDTLQQWDGENLAFS